MARLNQERQNELEPKRILYAKEQILKLGLSITHEDDKKIVFLYKEKSVTIYPYSGYFNGKSVKAGRGIENLLSQLSLV